MNEQDCNKCVSCPVLAIHAEQVEKYNRDIDEIMHLSFSDEPDEAAEEFQKLAHSMGIHDPAFEDAASIAASIRESTGSIVEELKQRIDLLNEFGETKRQDCKGPLGMRAVRNNVEYTARVCTSSDTPQKAPEPSFVERRQLPKN